MHAMADRSAVSTILGYFYQFDRSILTFLNLASDDDRIAIECIEDVDVYTATDVMRSGLSDRMADTLGIWVEYPLYVTKVASSALPISHAKGGLTGHGPKHLGLGAVQREIVTTSR